MLSDSERVEIAQEFPEHLARMRACLQQADCYASDNNITLAWARYSDSLCAGWLSLPNNDTDLTQILLSHLPPARMTEDGSLRLTLREADDDNGKAVLALPLTWLDQLGWTIGDTLLVYEEPPGQLTVRRDGASVSNKMDTPNR
ncbi:hypothetical protein [Burkholderia cepacia]|uniref:hypothetical protein n=1 Tax=Burkholderia cepacia TaxID=292 RepID=UPI00158E11CD|nr:hypothetical protein [Burkholderia cepacia]